MVKDPVCGMEVNEKKAVSYSFEGKEYYFCNETCLESFKKEPSKYMKTGNRKRC
jgi:Cu+-exporting ATPase